MRKSSPLLSLAVVAIAPLLAWGQTVPESISAEGVPEIPRALADQLDRFQHIRSASVQDWLADQREVLILTRFAATNQVHLVTKPGGARTQLTFLKDRVLSAEGRPGHRQFVFVADEGGAENYQLFLFDLVRGQIRRLTDGKSRNVFGAWSQSGRWLAYSSNARNGTDMDLYIVDVDRAEPARLLKEVKGDWSITDFSPDDRQAVAVERISINESYVSTIDLASGQMQTITPRTGQQVSYSDVTWSKDGRALLWMTDLNSEFRRLSRFDLAAKTSSVLSGALTWDVDDYDFSDDGRTLVFVANEAGTSWLHMVDLAANEELPAPKLPAGQISGLTFRPKSREFVFTLTTAKSPADVYSYDIDARRLERWTASETGGLNAAEFPEPSLVRFKSFDDRVIPAFIYRPGPRHKPPYPVLISIHGGPEGQFRPGFLGAANYFLDELGIAIVYPNVRGSSGYGKSYLKLDNGKLREDAVKDIGALLDWIAQQPDLDRNRVAVTGGSYGGFMSLATMTHYSDRLRAGIDLVGISNFMTMLQTTQSYRRHLRRAEYGDERDQEMQAFFEKVSPLSNASKIKVPILVVAGQNDPRVPVTESAQIVSAVKQNSVPLWYVVGKNEGHGFAKKENADYLQQVEALFLKTYLLGEGR